MLFSREPSVLSCVHATLCGAFRRGAAGLADIPSAKLRRAFDTLGLVQDECTPQEIRKAYINLAKKCHPDSGTATASTDQFILIRDAYKQCISYAKNVSLTREIHKAIEEELQSLDQTLGLHQQRKAAHRQYLDHDGVGPGTVSQREKAHTHHRLNRAQESVFEKKFKDALINNDTKEIELYSSWPKSTKVTNSLERIANEMIRDSIRKGEFSDLPGRGRPMEDTWENPVLSTMEQKINVMLGASGFAPDWITLDKEIRVEVKELKEEILMVWNLCGPRPMSLSKNTAWELNLSKLQEKVESINKKIRDRNLKGPLSGQKVHMKLDGLVAQVTTGVLPLPIKSAMSEVEERERTGKHKPESDHVAFIGITGFIVVMFALLYR